MTKEKAPSKRLKQPKGINQIAAAVVAETVGDKPKEKSKEPDDTKSEKR